MQAGRLVGGSTPKVLVLIFRRSAITPKGWSADPQISKLDLILMLKLSLKLDFHQNVMEFDRNLMKNHQNVMQNLINPQIHRINLMQIMMMGLITRDDEVIIARDDA